MIEAIIGCLTLCAWAAGLWYYPTCIESTSDCCCPPQNQGFIMDEAVASFTNENEDDIFDVIATAKKMETGDSPIISAQNTFPVAKALKYC